MATAWFDGTTDRIEVLVAVTILAVPFLLALLLPRLEGATSGGWAGVRVIALVAVVELPLAGLAVWAAGRSGRGLSSIGIVRPHPAWVVALLAVVVAAGWLVWLRHTGAWNGATSAAGAGGGAYSTAQMVALVLLGVPQIYLQELLYRGAAVTFLERATGSVVAALAISSAAFALAHLTSLGGNLAVSLLSVFVVGVLLGLLAVATSDVLPVFVIHWAWVVWLTVGLSGHVPSR